MSPLERPNIGFWMAFGLYIQYFDFERFRKKFLTMNYIFIYWLSGDPTIPINIYLMANDIQTVPKNI